MFIGGPGSSFCNYIVDRYTHILNYKMSWYGSVMAMVYIVHCTARGKWVAIGPMTT